MGYLKQRGATVLIASHQTQYFNDVDKVLQIVDGQITHFGTVKEVLGKGAKILGLDETSKQTSQPDEMIS